MEENESRIKTLLSELDKEYQGLNHYQRAKFAIEQIGVWQHKFNEAKTKILKEDFIDATPVGGLISQTPEIEA